MDIKKVTVIGGGVLGSQIAYQTAYRGYDVTIWLRSDASMERAKEKVARWHGEYLNSLEETKALIGTESPHYPRGLIDDFSSLSIEKIEKLKKQADEAFATLKYETNLHQALEDVDVVIESMSEDPRAKIELYTGIRDRLPEKTILLTNTSTLLPSQLAEYTGRPHKYLAMHFANQVWKNNTAEIMGHAGTSLDSIQRTEDFAKSIGMIPLVLKKEQPGYILNSLLVPFLMAGQSLYANGVADPKTIDLTWRMATGAPLGPFQILDIVGLKTAYDITVMDPRSKDPESIVAKIVSLLKEYIDAGKLGVSTGEGFYKYPRS